MNPRPLSRWLLFLMISSGWGCQELFLPEEGPEGPVANFDFVWQEVDRHYSFFDLKGIDWAGIYNEYRPWVDPGTTGADLFQLLSEMFSRLQDGHVSLTSPFDSYRYTGWYRPYPHNFDLTFIWYTQLVNRRQTDSGNILYGYVRDRIGYIYIFSFTGSDWVAEIDQVLAFFSDVDALIVDVRDNAGGSDANAARVAGRFTDERVLYRRIQYRNGPSHQDFSSLQDDYLVPRGRTPFLAPVAVLTNRRTFSAAESFVLAMRALPNVTVVGDVTGGGSGNPLQREMPNGWTFTISRWIEWAPNGTTHEGRGLEPDLPAHIPESLLGTVDPILQAAIQHLRGEII